MVYLDFVSLDIVLFCVCIVVVFGLDFVVFDMLLMIGVVFILVFGFFGG